MAQFQSEIFGSNSPHASIDGSAVSLANDGWIHELARGELHPDAERLLQLSGGFDVQQLVEESTIEFLSELRECFNRQVKVFNGYSESGGRFTEVKIYAIAQSAADFMLFRNQVKLIIANTAHGVIQIAFNQHGQAHGGGMIQSAVANSAAQGAQPAAVPGGAELLAQVGPFRDIYWAFQGERVTAAQVAKFFFSEFVRTTRETRRSKGGNQVLLDQIKALLQEKGLDL